jgi:putative ABC transport system substrate-binding protein
MTRIPAFKIRPRTNIVIVLARRFVAAAAAAVALLVPAGQVLAQQDRVPVVGWLTAGSITDPALEAFREGLRSLGYIEGRTVRIEARGGSDDGERLRRTAQELVKERADVIVSNGRVATRAVQEATATVPIVMSPVDDPYEFVASLSRPRGNITGLALQQTSIDAKQIEILKEVMPGLTRLAILYHYGETYYALAAVAHALNIEAHWIEIKTAEDVPRAFAVAVEKNASGLLIVDTTALGALCESIATLAAARRLPVAASWRGGPDTVLLVTYSADVAHLQQRAAAYVDRLLRGARPEDLPVEQVSKFELVVNLKAAKALGVTVPQPVLLRADVVIE